jgi:hypothetical protein
MGVAAKAGRNKITFLTPPALSTLGLWLEQLIAESTGKEGKGILPVPGEPPADPSVYGRDRLFVHYQLDSDADPALVDSVKKLREAGQPVVTLHVRDRMNLGQEILRWEIATAVAGMVIGINPFDQPNVKESKDNTNRLLGIFSAIGSLPAETAVQIEPPLSLFGAPRAAGIPPSLRKFFQKTKPGDYIAWLAYLPENATTDESLQDLRLHLRNRLHVATTLGYGPRYLHSTGQFHKGGPNSGLFILLTADASQDAEVPGAPYSFGTLIRAQAAGDMEALQKHGRRVVRIHLGKDIPEGLKALHSAILSALMKPFPSPAKKSSVSKPIKKSVSGKRAPAKKKIAQKTPVRKPVRLKKTVRQSVKTKVSAKKSAPRTGKGSIKSTARSKKKK